MGRQDVALLPVIGEIVHGLQIDRRPYNAKFIGAACEGCGVVRWISLSNFTDGRQLKCRRCDGREKVVYLHQARKLSSLLGILGEKPDIVLTYAKHDSCHHQFYQDYDYDSHRWCKTCLWCGYEETIDN